MRVGLPAQALLAAALAASLAGCGGGGDDLIDEDNLRDCLAQEGVSIEGPDLGASAGLGNVSPDFTAVTEDGAELQVVVQGNEQKAERTAADLRGALAGFGVAGSELVTSKNAIVIFEKAPSSQSRATVEGCLD